MFKLTTATLAAAIGFGAAQASADNLMRDFLLQNRSNQTIIHVVASNIGDPNFRLVDLLGDETVSPHHSLVVEPFDADGWCRFDFRITFENGLQQDVYDVNVCEITRLATYGDQNNGDVRVSYN